MRKITLAITIASFVLTPAAQADDLMDFMGGFKGRKLEKAIEKASAFPLGSNNNPIRVNMPQGQRQYLSRLRCENGEAPKFERRGSAGNGPFGSIADVYNVDCGKSAPANVEVYLDMYHPKHKETAAIPGFTIVE